MLFSYDYSELICIPKQIFFETNIKINLYKSKSLSKRSTEKKLRRFSNLKKTLSIWRTSKFCLIAVN